MAVLAICALAVAVAGGASARVPAHRGGEPRGGASHGLAYSDASNTVVQPQPRAGSCHVRGQGLYSRPDPRCTPGALNPAVTQSTIGRTICRAGWTRRVRPPESVTEREKHRSMAAYGDRGPAYDYEYDHLVALELGGATNASSNLWPEPGAAPNRKDLVENRLRVEVCAGRMTLARAQALIVHNWVLAYRRIARGKASAPSRTSGRRPRCRAAAVWNSRYGDYDVTVSSTEPDAEVTVTGAGATASYRTDTAGRADVYLDASPSSAGEQVTVTVGPASCGARLELRRAAARVRRRPAGRRRRAHRRGQTPVRISFLLTNSSAP